MQTIETELSKAYLFWGGLGLSVTMFLIGHFANDALSSHAKQFGTQANVAGPQGQPPQPFIPLPPAPPPGWWDPFANLRQGGNA